jgi:DNA-binding response OmpR family regulator
VHRLLEEGADAYLTKPLNIRELLAILESTLGRAGSTEATPAGAPAPPAPPRWH